jgi:pantoate--beta-alanine ligase
MQQIRKKKELKKAVAECRRGEHSIGFVPTMGALHQGHLSLIKQCRHHDGICIASNYVNPTQFNNKNDLRNYPRDPEKDYKLLENAGCDILFFPDDQEMYPEKDSRSFDFKEMGSVMEGKYRPGHFNGVAQIVTKLFDAVTPDRAYFGNKDFQQLAIIRKLVHDLEYPIEIIGCPIIREPDGLAMSSRNQLLSPDQREAAPLIYETLKKARDLFPGGKISDIEKFVEKQINNNPFLKLEYFQFVDAETLKQLRQPTSNLSVQACIAVFAGSVRLIDNIEIIS